MISIHGKEYVTVAERIQQAHKALDGNLSIETEVLGHDPVIIKATVKIGDRVYTGISAANPLKQIEKQSPYEVTETSAVGRALGFAGFGSVESIATADEIKKGGYDTPVMQMISPAQIKKIEVLLPQTRFGTIETFEEETGIKIRELSMKKTRELIAKLEDASMAKTVNDEKEKDGDF